MPVSADSNPGTQHAYPAAGFKYPSGSGTVTATVSDQMERTQRVVVLAEVSSLIVTIIVTVAPKQHCRSSLSGVLTSLESIGADERT
jgi:hypothetical protein